MINKNAVNLLDLDLPGAVTLVRQALASVPDSVIEQAILKHKKRQPTRGHEPRPLNLELDDMLTVKRCGNCKRYRPHAEPGYGTCDMDTPAELHNRDHVCVWWLWRYE